MKTSSFRFLEVKRDSLSHTLFLQFFTGHQYFGLDKIRVMSFTLPMKLALSQIVRLACLLPLLVLASCNLLSPLPEPVSVSNAIKGQLLNWTRGARTLQAEVRSTSGAWAFAKSELHLDGSFQLDLPTTLNTNQGLYSLSGPSCLQVSPSSVQVRDFFSLGSYYGTEFPTAIVAIGSKQGLYGWMYATQDASVQGTCNVTDGSIIFALNLKAGWNQVAIELPNSTTLRYVTSNISTDATWEYIPQKNSNFIASPVATFKIGEPVRIKVLDTDLKERKIWFELVEKILN